MNYTDLNRLGGIGANSSLYEVGSFRFVVDAGIHPKETGKASLPMLDRLNGEQPIDFVILTHCHLDHLGALPLLLKKFPDVPVFMSIPTRMLAGRMLRNSVNVMKRQGREQSIPEYPFFSFAEVERIEHQYEALRFDTPKVLRKGKEKMEIVLYPSGHVVGAASVLVQHDDASIFITGDILFDDQLTLPGAWIPEMQVDIVVTETTRGCTQRAKGRSREEECARLYASMTETLKGGGSCLLPVFALGRLQEIMAMLHLAMKRGELPKSPVFSGGLGLDLVDYFDDIAKDTGLVRFRRRILNELKVGEPRYPKIPGQGAMPQGIYVLSSGMMVEYTPSYQAAATLVGSERNRVHFVGYCDPDTPGGKLRAAKPGDPISFDAYDLSVTLRSPVEVYDLSGHADRDELLHLVQGMDPEAVILTHGDAEARVWFKERLGANDATCRVLDPEPGKTYEV